MKSILNTKALFTSNLIVGMILINIFISSAQTKILTINQISGHIGSGLSKNYHPDSIALSKLCRHACIFIKFKVDQKGQVTGLSFSKDKDSLLFIKDALTRAIYSLQKDSELMETLKRSDKTIIQPFIYAYEAGCNFPKSKDSDFSMTEAERDQWALKYFRIRSSVDHFWETLSSMLNFGDGNSYIFNSNNLNAIDNCILLSPVQVSNIVME